MRLISIIIVLAAAGFIAYIAFFQEKPLSSQWALPWVSSRGQAIVDNNQVQPAPSPANQENWAVYPSDSPESFRSNIPVNPDLPPGTKPVAPPGVYYVTERVTFFTKDGVVAIIPGEPLKLLQRPGNGTVKVTTGDRDFVVKESQLTNDLTEAQEAERKDFALRPH